MSKKIIVSPSILSGDFANMGKSVKDVEEWGGDWIHCDVMDGVYVTNITFGMPMISAIKKITALPLDVHLMIDKPEKYVERFIDAGANYVTFHPETSGCPSELLKKIRAKGAYAGIAFNPNVKIEDYENLFTECDIIVIMTVYAGYGGQKLIEECLDRITYVKKKLSEINSDALIEVDGGITEENSSRAVQKGADVLVAGSAVFKSDNPSHTISIIKGVTK